MIKVVCRFFAVGLLLCGVAAPVVAKPYVCMQTNVGEFCMELLPEVAPRTVENFLHYVDDGDYSDSMIHRSEPGFVIQGGGFKVFSNLVASLTVDPPIPNEFSLSNQRGTVAMARLSGNQSSATSQWFVNLANNTNLDVTEGGYAVFARIVKGMDVVDNIAALRRVNLNAALNASAFSTVPTTADASTTTLELSQLVRVVRAYRAEPAQYQCTFTSPGDTLTEFCGSTLNFPVLVGGKLFDATLNFVPGRSGLVFAVDMGNLKLLTDSGQPRAEFANNVLTIPSVRYGALALDNVKLNLTSSAPLEFTVSTYTRR